MANVLLLEPPGDVRDLVLWALGRAGHEVSVDVADPSRHAAIILEPADPPSLAKARALVAQRPELPVICTSIEPRQAIDGLEPAVYLVKPFGLGELEMALERVLATGA